MSARLGGGVMINIIASQNREPTRIQAIVQPKILPEAVEQEGAIADQAFLANGPLASCAAHGREYRHEALMGHGSLCAAVYGARVSRLRCHRNFFQHH